MLSGITTRRALGTVLAVALLGAACSGNDASEDDSTTTQATAQPTTSEVPAAETTTTVAEQTPTARAIEFYNALNAGSEEGMQAAWPTGDPVAIALLVDIRQRASVACSPGDEPDLVVCQEGAGNAFYDPAGVQGVFTVRYEVADGVIVASELIDAGPAVVEYTRAFGEWLEGYDPDLYASSYQASGSLPFEDSAQALAVIAKVDEFLAQSDTYPLSR